VLKTLKEARESSLSSMAGACPLTPEFLRILNEATERLMNRGDWPGTIVPIQTCVYQGCVVWPRYVGTVRHINACNVPLPVQNMWTQFLLHNSPNWQQGTRWWGVNGWGSNLGATITTTGLAYGNGTFPYMMDQGKSPTFQDIQGDGRFVRFYPQYQADIGKTITIFGVDNNNQPLMTKQADGTWREGWVVTLAAPYGSTSDFVRRIDRLLLDDMQGQVFGYAYNSATSLLEPLGQYEPGDVNPAFERYRLELSGVPNANCLQSVVALVKLKFIPARYDADLVLIDNIPALKLMMGCIRAEEANNLQLANEFEVRAIRELNRDLDDKSPKEQIQVGLSTLGQSSYRAQRMF